MESILIIEDDLDVLKSWDDTLKTKGYNSLTADNKESGLKKAKEHTPDLILCNIGLPDGDEGFEILIALRKELTTQNIPFIFLTARDCTKDIVRGLKLGAQDYISKTAEMDEILARVRTHLEIIALRKKLERKNELLEIEQKKVEKYREMASENLRDILIIIKGEVEMLEKQTEITFKKLKAIDHSCDQVLGTIEKYGEQSY